ncbi:MAG: type II toxin-antitoxin system VapC family toxin [Actinomycetota bacterium]|nr:type II toxin-antitoxin system VapC family toxin [Actinomycetota bacterium]
MLVLEAGTAPLRAFLSERDGERMVSSVLVRTELRRATLRFGARTDVTREQTQNAAQGVTALLRTLDLVRVSSSLLDDAGQQLPPQLRSLDAIHLATALVLGSPLRAVVAYDHRLLDAARDAGLPTAAP